MEYQKSFTEQITVAGKDLVNEVKRLMHDSTAKRIVIRNEQGKELMAIPLVAGAGIGIAAIFYAPTLAAVAGLAAVLGSYRLDVERTGTPTKR